MPDFFRDESAYLFGINVARLPEAAATFMLSDQPQGVLRVDAQFVSLVPFVAGQR